MEPTPLRAQLESLHRELLQSPSLDERGREALAGVEADLRRLGDAPTPPVEREEMQSRWKSAVVEFESSHPQLASGLEQMANLLSNFGL